MFTFKEALKKEPIGKSSGVTGRFKIAKSDDDKRLASISPVKSRSGKTNAHGGECKGK